MQAQLTASYQHWMQDRQRTVNEMNFHCSPEFETAYYCIIRCNDFVLRLLATDDCFASFAELLTLVALITRDLART